mgnify:CR=1 FL=1
MASTEKEESEEEAVVKPEEPRIKWTEVPAIFMFVAIISGFIALSIIDLLDYSNTSCYNALFGDPRVKFFSPSILVVLSSCLGVTFILSIIYLACALRAPGWYLYTSLILQIVVTLIGVIIHLVQTSWLSGALCIFWLFLSLFLYWVLRKNKRKSVVQMTIVSELISKNPSVIVISILGAIFCSACSVLVAADTIAGFAKSVSDECSVNRQLRPEGEFLGLLTFIAISHYMMVEVVKGSIRVATSSVFGWWYYVPNELFKASEFIRLHGVTWEGLFLALTYSSGSVCLSIFFLALSKLGAQVIGAWSQELMVSSVLAQTQDISAIVLAWVLSNCVWCLNSILSHFTNYVLVNVALYNHTYFKGVQQTMHLVTSQGGKTLINDCLAGGTFAFASWCIGTLSALAAYIYMRWIALFDTEGIYFVTSFIVIVSIQISSIILVSIPTGLQTVYVAFNNDPHILQETHPHIYELLMECL